MRNTHVQETIHSKNIECGDMLQGFGSFIIPMTSPHYNSIPDKIRNMAGTYIEMVNSVYNYNAFLDMSRQFATMSSCKNTSSERSGRYPFANFNRLGAFATVNRRNDNKMTPNRINNVFMKDEPGIIPVNLTVDFYKYNKQKETRIGGAGRTHNDTNETTTTKMFQEKYDALIVIMASILKSPTRFDDYLIADVKNIINRSSTSYAKRLWARFKDWIIKKYITSFYTKIRNNLYGFHSDLYEIKSANFYYEWPSIERRTYVLLNAELLPRDVIKIIMSPNAIGSLYERGWSSFVLYFPSDRQIVFNTRVITRMTNPLVSRRAKIKSVKDSNVGSEYVQFGVYPDYRVLNLDALTENYNLLKRNNVLSMDDIVKLLKTNSSLSGKDVIKLGEVLS